MKNKKLELWNSVEKTEFGNTKPFNRSGGFAGTAVNATYRVKRATEAFGPMGMGWGVEIVNESILDGRTKEFDGVMVTEKIHRVLLKLWYIPDGWESLDKASDAAEYPSVQQFGATTYIGFNKYGPFCDEEAFKKSITDAMSKCLSLLGFSADVHLSLWDDSKYVSARKQEADDLAAVENFNPQDAQDACVDALANRYTQIGRECDALPLAKQAVGEWKENHDGKATRKDWIALLKEDIPNGVWDYYGEDDPISQKPQSGQKGSK